MAVRRRRECKECSFRFSTYEYIAGGGPTPTLARERDAAFSLGLAAFEEEDR